MADPEKNAPEALAVDEVVGGSSIIDPALEKRVLRKLDLNLVTLVSVLYMLSFLDRSNIGNAKIVRRMALEGFEPCANSADPSAYHCV